MRYAVRRRWNRAVRAYHLRCAREDARRHGIVVPLGLWLCEHCPHMSFTAPGFVSHLVEAH